MTTVTKDWNNQRNSETVLDTRNFLGSIDDMSEPKSFEEISREIFMDDIKRDIEADFDRQFTEWNGDSDGTVGCD